jgi:hypothetical protein
VALGLSGGSDPVWRGAAFSGSPTAPSVGSRDPSSPVPGSTLALVGRGFDWIIPANNRVFFPGAAGPVQGEVRSVTDTRLTTVMPLGTTAGSIRVVTTVGESSIPFTPRFGSIHVRAHLTGDVPAPGQHVIVRRGATIDIAGEANTDAQGTASFDLAPGDYTVQLQPATGYQLFSGTTVQVHLDYAVADVVFDMGVVPVRVTLDPPSPLSLEVGAIVNVRAHPVDVNGNELTTFRSIRWNGSSRVQVGGGLDARVAGVAASATAGDATFQLQLDGVAFDFSATVTSFVTGTVTQIPDGGGTATPVRNVSVQVRDAAGHATNATTNDAGVYRLAGLMGSTYTLSVNTPVGYAASPVSRTVTLGPGASGQDFQLARFYVEGTVTEIGSPAAGVTVQIFPSGGATSYATVTTGSDGKYKFTPIPAGTYDVKVVPTTGKVANPASRTVTVDASHTSVSGQDFTVLGTSIAGSVRRGGDGVAGATVRLYPSGVSTPIATTTSTATGGYVFNGVGAGSFDVKAVAPAGNVVSPEVRTVSISGGAPAATGVDFNLTLTYIEGTITQSGTPVPSVTVQLFPAGLGTQLATTTTNGSGVYRFEGMGTGSFDIKPTAPANTTVTPTSRTVTLSSSVPGTSAQNFTLASSGGAIGVVRTNLMLCGSSSRPVSNFMPAGYSLPIVNSCAPDSNTQALLVTRNGAYGLNATALQSYVNGGGIVITEYDVSNVVWNAVFGTNVYLGNRMGACWDVVPSVVQMNSSDPFWAGNTFRTVPTDMTGCGYSVNGYPGITTLLGWDASNAALGYRDLGQGRVWAVEWDWQDNETYLEGTFDHVGDLSYMNRMMGYMILHRGAGAGLRTALRSGLPTPTPIPAVNAPDGSGTRAVVRAGVRRSPTDPAAAERRQR